MGPLNSLVRFSFVGVAIFLLVGLIVVFLTRYSSTTSSSQSVERGKYLVSVAGCNDCHTPWKMGLNGPEPDMSRFLSGHPETLTMTPPPDLGAGPWLWMGAGTNTAFAGPWGISYAFNLTPDDNTGVGIWTEDQFVRTIRFGKHWGQSRPILPPMPWQAYRNMTDEDLKSIYAYLRTIPPIVNRVPESLTREDLEARQKEGGSLVPTRR
ncbi:MAG TPA: c-type cytochrome [Acidobacteriota bacterium]|nr:c-type cytochrome [Acidobacteriota bacterium]